MKYLAVLFVSIFFAAIAAVGVSVADPPRAEAAGGYAAKCGGGRILLQAPEKRLFDLHNRERTQRRLPRLCVHPALKRAAEVHSQDMIRRDYFSHYTKGTNKGPCERIRRYGYRYRYCAENIGANYPTPDGMFRAWMGSSGHRRNILSGKYREVGIGVYAGDYNGKRTTMYTVDFGTRL